MFGFSFIFSCSLSTWVFRNRLWDQVSPLSYVSAGIRVVACWERFVMFHVLCFEPGIRLHSCPSWIFSLFLLKDFQSANSCGFSFSRANNFQTILRPWHVFWILLTSWVCPIRWKLCYETQVPLLLCTGETYRQQSKPIQTSRWILDNRWWYLRQVSHPCMAFFGFQRRSIGHTQRTYLFGVIGFSFLDSIFRWHRCLHIPWMRDLPKCGNYPQIECHHLKWVNKKLGSCEFSQYVFFVVIVYLPLKNECLDWKTTFPFGAKGLLSWANCSTSGARVPFPDSPWDSNIYLHLSLSIHLVTL